MFRASITLALALSLAACGQQDEPAALAAESQRVTLGPLAGDATMALPSPDTTGALWQVSEDGQAITFGQPGSATLLTLACHLGADPPQLAIIRHAPAKPGQKALFPVIGNGMRSRFPVDATLEDGEWRWEEVLPSTDPMLDVFGGRRDLTATLPGGGMLEIAGSPVPGEFLEWCRAGGELAEALEDEAEGEAPTAGTPSR